MTLRFFYVPPYYSKKSPPKNYPLSIIHYPLFTINYSLSTINYLWLMPKILRIFCWGLVISFLGSLPLGTLNIAAMQIGIQESLKDAIYFSFGSLLVEMIYVRISLVGIDWVRK